MAGLHLHIVSRASKASDANEASEGSGVGDEGKATHHAT